MELRINRVQINRSLPVVRKKPLQTKPNRIVHKKPLQTQQKISTPQPSFPNCCLQKLQNRKGKVMFVHLFVRLRDRGGGRSYPPPSSRAVPVPPTSTYGHQAGGTHPTGMLIVIFIFKMTKISILQIPQTL